MLQKMEQDLKQIWTKAMSLHNQSEEQKRLVREYYIKFEQYKKQKMMLGA